MIPTVATMIAKILLQTLWKNVWPEEKKFGDKKILGKKKIMGPK